eukprot:6174250-Pleurochrysis_carterae.AAC.1
MEGGCAPLLGQARACVGVPIRLVMAGSVVVRLLATVSPCACVGEGVCVGAGIIAHPLRASRQAVKDSSTTAVRLIVNVRLRLSRLALGQRPTGIMSFVAIHQWFVATRGE